MVCTIGLAPAQLACPPQVVHPAGSVHAHVEDLLIFGISSGITGVPLEAGAASIHPLAEAKASIGTGRRLTLASGGNSEAVCTAGAVPVYTPIEHVPLLGMSQVQASIEMGRCFIIAGGGNSEAICTAGAVPV